MSLVPSRCLLIACLIALTVAAAVIAGDPAPTVISVHDLATLEGFDDTQDTRIVPNGPDHESVLEIDGNFMGDIDLGAMGIDPHDYDLLKVEIKTNRGVFLRFSLENYPNAGDLSHWYSLDGARGPEDWQTLTIDLRRPEEIKPPKSFKGMENADLTRRGLAMQAHSLPEHGPLWMSRIRLVKKVIDLDWDQRAFDLSTNDAGDLIYRYPLQLRNLQDTPVEVELELTPFQQVHATAQLDATSVALAAGETKTITATISLPGAIAKTKAALYTERFAVSAAVPGIADSRVTLLRSSDPLHLTVTVPIPEDRLQWPLFPALPRDLPDDVVMFDEAAARAALSGDIDSVIAAAKTTHMEKTEYMGVLVSAAYLYQLKGDRDAFEIARKLLLALPAIWQARLADYEATEIRMIAHGVIAHAGLRLGWRVGGTQRPPYFYGGRGNAGPGKMSSIAYVFDFLANELSAEERQSIIDGFLLPAAIQARNHYVGPNNMQLTQDTAALYGGLVARNWPLVAFSVNSEHGLEPLLTQAFGTDGMTRRESEHQTYAINPVLWMTELLLGVGMDKYDERLHTIIHSRTALALKAEYKHSEFADFLDAKRFAGKPFMDQLTTYDATTGEQLDGFTWLRYNGVEVKMNWNLYTYRGCPALNALWIKRDGVEYGGIVENQGDRSLFGNSAIIVDETRRSPANHATEWQIAGPVQYVQSVSDPAQAEWRTWRTYAIVHGHVLVVDRVVSEQPRTVDWLMRNPPAKPELTLAKTAGSFTDKPRLFTHNISYGAEMQTHAVATTDAMWQTTGGLMTVAAAPATEVYAYDWMQSATLMMRRRGVTKTDFLVALSPDLETIAQQAVTRSDGSAADAVGLTVTLKSGESFQVIVSYEEDATEVRLGDLSTTRRFATDYATD